MPTSPMPPSPIAAAPHRRFTLLLLVIVLPVVAACAVFARHLEPLSGDLTRIGWYAENEFGWTEQKLRFDPLTAEEGRLGRGYDVIAVGDSFTAEAPHNPGVTWPHFFAQATGLKVAIFDSGINPLEEIVASPQFRNHPPPLVIYEVVERSLGPVHGQYPGAACTGRTPPPPVLLPIAARAGGPKAVTRRTTRALDDWPVGYALNFVVQNALRWATDRNPTSAVRMEMNRGGLFSSRFDRGLLVYAEDFNKIGWSAETWRAAGCDLLRLQDLVQANGKTLFLAMVVPDKLTVYTPFLPYRTFDAMSKVAVIADVPGLNYVRLDDRLDPVAQVDLYLPNDTHWSTHGHALAARRLLEVLAERGALRQ